MAKKVPSNSNIDAAAARAGSSEIDNLDELLDLWDTFKKTHKQSDSDKLNAICRELNITSSDLNDWTNDRQGSKPVKTKSANLYVNEMIKHGWDLEDLEGQRKKILDDPWLTDRERDAWESFFDNVEDGYKDYRAQVKKGTQKKGQPYDPSATFNTNDNDPD